jgi:hypothetical protein
MLYASCTGDDALEYTNNDTNNNNVITESTASPCKLSQIFMCLLNVLLYDERRAIIDKTDDLDKVIEDDKFFDNVYFASATASTSDKTVTSDTKASSSSRDAQREAVAETNITELAPDTDTILSGLKGSWSLFRASCVSWQEAVRLLLLRREKLLQYSSSDNANNSNAAVLGTHMDAIGECRRILVHVMKAAGKDVSVTNKRRLGRPRKTPLPTTADNNDVDMDIDDVIDESNDACNTEKQVTDDIDVANLKSILQSIDTGWYNTYTATSIDTTATVSSTTDTTGDSTTSDTEGTGHVGIAKDVVNYLTSLAYEAECDIDDLDSPEAIAAQEFIELYNKRVLQPLQFKDQQHELIGWSKVVSIMEYEEFDTWDVTIIVHLLSWLCEQVLDTKTMQEIIDKAQDAKEVS